MQTKSFTKENFEIFQEGHIISLIPRDTEVTQTLLFIHGFNDFFKQWLPILISPKFMPKGTKIVYPIGDDEYNYFFKIKGPSWFVFKQLKDEKQRLLDIIPYEKLEIEKDRLNKIADKEIELLKGDSKKLFVGGFSQGATMGFYFASKYKAPLGGIVIFGALFTWPIVLNQIQDYTPIFWYQGTDDSLTQPYELVYQMNSIYHNEKRYIEHFQDIGMGHGISMKGIIAAKSFVDYCLYLGKPKL